MFNGFRVLGFYLCFEVLGSWVLGFQGFRVSGIYGFRILGF